MSAEIRIVLLVGAVFTLLYFAQYIRKGRMQIDYAIYWILFSGALVVLSVFPGIAEWAARILHVQSPVNLVFLCISFLLILKLFTTTQKLSKLNQQVNELAQHIALYEQREQHVGLSEELRGETGSNEGGAAPLSRFECRR